MRKTNTSPGCTHSPAFILKDSGRGADTTAEASVCSPEKEEQNQITGFVRNECIWETGGAQQMEHNKPMSREQS